jgi:hypothetical protein
MPAASAFITVGFIELWENEKKYVMVYREKGIPL